ncbi:hypothetical protein ACTFIR_003856 [Dictyostelium discoideum]
MKLLVPKRKEEKCHQGNKKLFKVRFISLSLIENGINYSPIPQDAKSKVSYWLTVLNQWNGKEINLFPSYDYVLITDASESGTGATLKKGNKVIKTWSFQWSTSQSNMVAIEASISTFRDRSP